MLIIYINVNIQAHIKSLLISLKGTSTKHIYKSCAISESN